MKTRFFLLSSGVVALAIVSSALILQIEKEPEIIIEYIEKPCKPVKCEPVECQPVVITEYIYGNIFPRQFESIEHFKQWYEEQGFIPLTIHTPDADCNTSSVDLQRVALTQGYMVSQALTLNGIYFGKKVTDVMGGHAGNMIKIDDAYYFVESQPDNLKVAKICEK